MSLTREELAARVRQEIDRAGLTHAALAKRIDMDPTALSKALNGTRDFKSLEIASIADEIRIPVHRLLSDAPMMPAMIAARAQPGVSMAVNQATDQVTSLLDLDELLDDAGFPSKSVLPVGYQVQDDDPVGHARDMANAVRERMDLAPEDLLPRELSELAGRLEEQLGVDIEFIGLPDGLDGLSIVRGRFSLALINSGVPRTRQRYTLLHEIGHLAAGDAQNLLVDENIYGQKSLQETRANAFAASILMTAESLRAAVAGRQLDDEAIIADLRDRYQVSLQALAFRLHNLKLINAAGRDRILAMPPARQTLLALQGRLEKRAPGSLLARAAGAYLKGAVGIRPLAALLDTPEDTLLDRLTPPADRTHDDATDALEQVSEAGAAS